MGKFICDTWVITLYILSISSWRHSLSHEQECLKKRKNSKQWNSLSTVFSLHAPLSPKILSLLHHSIRFFYYIKDSTIVLKIKPSTSPAGWLHVKSRWSSHDAMVPDHSRSADQLVNNIYIQYENLITSVKRNRKPIFCTEAMLYNNHCNKSYKRVEVDVSTPFLKRYFLSIL